MPALVVLEKRPLNDVFLSLFGFAKKTTFPFFVFLVIFIFGYLLFTKTTVANV